MKLRGADETWVAVQNGQYAPTVCLSCEKNLLVILDVECVLCPACRVVSPILVDDDACGYRDKDCKPSNHGVGLGFTVEDLLRWQDEMARGIDPSRNGF
jgi:phage FluMu protein Com